MNYYNEIKRELINNEAYKKVKDYSKNNYALIVIRYIECNEEIEELQEQISLLKSEPDNDYGLYRSILDLIVPNLKFEYAEEGYLIKIDPPLVMPLEHINELIKELDNKLIVTGKEIIDGIMYIYCETKKQKTKWQITNHQ